MKFSLWTFLRRHCQIWQTDHLLKLLQLEFKNSRLHLWFWIISLKSAGKTFDRYLSVSITAECFWLQNGGMTTCLWNNLSVFYSQESRHIKQHFYSFFFSASGYFLPHKRRSTAADFTHWRVDSTCFEFTLISACFILNYNKTSTWVASATLDPFQIWSKFRLTLCKCRSRGGANPAARSVLWAQLEFHSPRRDAKEKFN